MRETARRSILLLVLVNLAGIPALGQKPVPPPPQPPRPFRFPEFTTRTLPNGLRVIVIEHREQPTVSLRLLVRAGAEQDPPDRPGLASLTAALLDQGTKTRSAMQIAEAIEFVGGQISTGASWHQSFVAVSVPKPGVEVAFEILADVVRHPVFAEDEIERQRQQLLSGLRVQANDPGYLASTAIERALFGAHPYGHPPEGTLDSLPRLTRADLIAFHQAVYHPNNSLLAIAGDITAAEAFAKAEKYFGDWPKGEVRAAVVPAPAPTRGRKLLLIEKSDAVQTEIRLGKVGIARRDPDYFALQVLNAILASASGSRLWDVLRRERGLTYGISSRLEARQQPGSLTISTFTRTEKTSETLQLVLSELDRIARERVTEEELRKAKNFLAGVFQLRLETPESLAAIVLDAVNYDFDYAYLNAYRDRLLSVTAEQVQEVARKYVRPEDLVIVLVGNVSAFEKDVAHLGPMERIAYTDVDFTRPDLKRERPAAVAATPETRARAREILAEVMRAVGGREAVVGIRDVAIAGEATISTPFGEFKGEHRMFVRLPDRLRTEVRLPQMTIVQVLSGDSGWVSTPMGTQEVPAPMVKELRAALRRFFFQLLRAEEQEGVIVSYLGSETVEGKSVDVLQYQDGEHVFKLYIETASRLPLKLSYQGTDPFSGTRAEFEEVYSDYREIAGVKYPFRTLTRQEGKRFAELVLSDVKINAGVSDDLFKKP
ncbi:MAG: insulinase family protein [Blastocatellia bacterium]|nr:insulinase family protein [Blastocatellia bacterium]MCS7158519.1 insulinase family protein [Blastocatellia bacterium]MDW8167802.1 insulinase family protein [Acidobacteriota bacterium]MDW8257562.1 insulinase family protein [Acidobacteriota bacterium]